MKQHKKSGGKRRIVEDLMAKGFTKRQGEKGVDTVFRLIGEALSCQESVEVPGIGTLEVVIQKGRAKRSQQKTLNIATKEVQIREVEFPGRRRVVKLRPDSNLKLSVSRPESKALKEVSTVTSNLTRLQESVAKELVKIDRIRELQLASKLVGLPLTDANTDELRQVAGPEYLLQWLRDFDQAGRRFREFARLRQVLAECRQQITNTRS